jgi:hypothetical protein
MFIFFLAMLALCLDQVHAGGVPADSCNHPRRHDLEDVPSPQELMHETSVHFCSKNMYSN